MTIEVILGENFMDNSKIFSWTFIVTKQYKLSSSRNFWYYEIDENSFVKKILTVQNEGKRKVNRDVN